MVRGVLLLAVSVLVVGGCGGDSGDESRLGLDEECQARLVWDGVTYYSAGSPQEPLVLGKQLGKGQIPRCSGEPGPALDILRIRGVDPAVAVVAGGEGDPPYAWLALSYVPESTRHPLHDAIYGSPGEPSAEAGFRCEPPRRLRARALNTPASDFTFLQVRLQTRSPSRSSTQTTSTASCRWMPGTVIEGHERGGIPFIHADDEFSLVLRECVGTQAEPGLAGLRRLEVERLEP